MPQDPNSDHVRMLEQLRRRVLPSTTREVPRMSAGTVFPTGVSAGYRFFRTDLGFDCYYDGTQWLTIQEYAINFQQPSATITGAGSYIIGPVRQDYAPYITRVTTETIVLGTSNGSNYWTITLRGLTTNYGAASTFHALTTAGNASNVWSGGDGGPNASATPSNRALFDVSVAITAGAPGALLASVTVYYRLIIP